MLKFVSSVGSSSSDAIPEAKASTGSQFFPRAHSVLSRLAKLPQDELRKYKGWIRSNDVAITGLEKYRVAEGEQLMLIASTSLNPIAVACELATNNKMQIIPQVVMIDDSETASTIWKALRKLFKDNNATRFSRQLRSYIETNSSLMTPATSLEGVARFVVYAMDYVEEVIQKYQYDFVKAVVLQTVYLEQKWEDESTFDGIRNFIDVSGCKNIFVYPSNIISLNNEYIAKRICQNISKLNPRLTIHVNMNIDLWCPTEFLFLEGEAENMPDVTIERITAAIRFDETPSREEINGLFYIVSPQQYKILLWENMHKAINKMINDNQYRFNQYNTPFMLDIIFRLAGINTKIDHYVQDIAEYRPATVFHVRTPYDEMASALKILKVKFPSLDARFSLLGQVPAEPDWPTRIALNMVGLTHSILPLIPPYLSANPDVRLHYETSHLVQRKITELFENYHMSTGHSDCFEETLCLLVKKKLESEGVEAEELVTTKSLFDLDPNHLNHTNIFLTTPAHAAKHIADYFNKIIKDTASVEEKQEWVADKNAYLTKITVANSTLISDQCLEDLTFAVENWVSKEVTDDYWREAGYEPPSDGYQNTRMSM